MLRMVHLRLMPGTAGCYSPPIPFSDVVIEWVACVPLQRVSNNTSRQTRVFRPFLDFWTFCHHHVYLMFGTVSAVLRALATHVPSLLLMEREVGRWRGVDMQLCLKMWPGIETTPRSRHPPKVDSGDVSCSMHHFCCTGPPPLRPYICTKYV